MGLKKKGKEGFDDRNFCGLNTVCLGSTNHLALCWTLPGGMMSQVVKNGPASYIVPGCMALNPCRADNWLFFLLLHEF